MEVYNYYCEIFNCVIFLHNIYYWTLKIWYIENNNYVAIMLYISNRLNKTIEFKSFLSEKVQNNT